MGETNQKPPGSAIGKRRKTAVLIRFSCKYDYFSKPQNAARSIAYRLITDDDVKRRNAPEGQNYITLGRLCITSFYDYWKDYLRREYVIAKGQLSPTENDSKIIQRAMNTHAKNDLWGDLRYLRNSIVHSQGIANSDVGKSKLITWFKSGDIIALTPNHMREIFIALLKYRNDLNKEQYPPTFLRVPDFYSLPYKCRSNQATPPSDPLKTRFLTAPASTGPRRYCGVRW